MNTTSTASKKYVRKPVRCSICTETRLSAARWPVGYVCNRCYGAERRSARQCTGCRQVRVLVGHPDAPTDRPLTPSLCGPCCGSRRYSYICLRCGGSEELYKGRVCVRCALSDQLIEAFGAAARGSAVALLQAALHASRRPRSVMAWLTNERGGARVLRHLLSEGITISHEALDSFDEREVWSLRRTLVDLDVLPERHDPIARLGVVTEKVTAEMLPNIRSLVRAYASWWYLRRARQRYEQTGKFTYSQFRNAWTRLGNVGSFLTWLNDHDVSLETLDQTTLDIWLDKVSNDQRTATSDFLRWAARRNLAPRLTVTYPEAREPTILMSDEQRWAELRRCLTDATIPVDIRVAGAMLLLYGIPLHRIIELTRAHLLENAETGLITGFTVSLGSPVIEVPPNLGRLLAELPAETTSRGRPLITAKPDALKWLFPGRGTRGHITYTGITARLRTHGISTRQSRNAALIGLASDLPAPVMCDLFGLSIAASVKWSRRAARDWAGYLSIIEQREQRQPTDAVRRPNVE